MDTQAHTLKPPDEFMAIAKFVHANRSHFHHFHFLRRIANCGLVTVYHESSRQKSFAVFVGFTQLQNFLI